MWYSRPNSKGKDKLDARWESGIWLGVRDESGESVIGNSEGIIQVRTVRRKPQSEKWNQELFQSVKGTPWNTVPGTNQDEIRSKVVFPTVYESIVPDKPPEPKEFFRRRIRITRDDVKHAGMTPGCEGCVAANRGITSRPHSEECRMKMEEYMSKRQDKRIERY